MSRRDFVYFISDAHLGIDFGVAGAREAHLIEFLKSSADRMSHLFIVGDLFDFWVEYREAIRPVFFNILHVLRSLVESGIQIHYLAGNHDFALGNFLPETIGIQLHQDWYRTTLQGKLLHIQHGDGVLASDVGYRVLKRILRNKTNQRLFRLLHPNLGVKIAQSMSLKSRNSAREELAIENLPEYRDRAREITEKGPDIVVFGHTHHPRLHHFEDSKTYCNTGEWIHRYTYGELFKGRLRLLEHVPGGADKELPAMPE
jgi:UDP-2,3-diacylglucosamine hydrolase